MVDTDSTVPGNIPSYQDSKEAQLLIGKLQDKIARLVEDFAAGAINRAQFHELYGRYQRQVARLIQMMLGEPNPDANDPEDTFVIKKRLTARVLGVSIYSNETRLPIETLGDV